MSTREGPLTRLLAAFNPPMPTGPRNPLVSTGVASYVAWAMALTAAIHLLSPHRSRIRVNPPRRAGQVENCHSPKRAPARAPAPQAKMASRAEWIPAR